MSWNELLELQLTCSTCLLGSNIKRPLQKTRPPFPKWVNMFMFNDTTLQVSLCLKYISESHQSLTQYTACSDGIQIQGYRDGASRWQWFSSSLCGQVIMLLSEDLWQRTLRCILSLKNGRWAKSDGWSRDLEPNRGTQTAVWQRRLQIGSWIKVPP